MIYFVQGVITSYQLNFFKPHMASAGVDADRIAIVASLALLPFIVKLLFGLLSDRFNLFGMGHRLPYMVAGVTLCALAFFGAYFVDPGRNFGVLAAMVLVSLGGMAFSLFTDLNLLLIFGALWGLVVGLQWTVYAALAMGVTDLRIAGSMFALFQTMSNIGIAAGEGVATSLSNNPGFPGVFRLLAGVSLLLIPLFLVAMRRFARPVAATQASPATLS